MAVLFLFAVLMISCSGGNSAAGVQTKESPNPNNGADIAKQVSEQPTEIDFYVAINGWTDDKFMTMYGNKIKEKFPNYTLKFIPQISGSKTLTEVLTGGQNIDILVSSIGLTSDFLIKLNMQSDISDLIKKYNYDLSRLNPSVVEVQRQLANGGIYGLPVYNTTAELFYNKELFNRFGVPFPKDGMNWDELYELAKRMTRTDSGVKYRGFASSYSHMMVLSQLSMPYLDEKTYKARFLDDDFKRAFANLMRFIQIPGNEMPKNKFTTAGEKEPFYKDKTTAMYASLGDSATTFAELLDWDVVGLPYFKDKMGVGPQPYPYYFYLSSSSKHRDAAFQVMAQVTSDEYQDFIVRNGNVTILSNPDAMKNFGKDIPYFKGKNVQALLPAKFAAPAIKTKYQSIADDAFKDAVNDVAAGTDINTALRKAAEAADKEIAAAEGK
jgi:multiple sugar transport system substrate-binding protein